MTTDISITYIQNQNVNKQGIEWKKDPSNSLVSNDDVK